MFVMNSRFPSKSASPLMTRVYGIAEIEYLVKESEVLTGQAGRIFVIVGADKLTYRVHWHPMIIDIERLDDFGAVIDIQHQPPQVFASHSVVEALMAGQLYTPSVQTVH